VSKLTCPTCGSILTVSDNAPAQVTCPRCLQQVATSQGEDSVRPLAVLPLQREADVDETASAGASVAVAVLLGIGACALFVAGRPASGLFVIAVIFVIVMALVTRGPFRRRSAVLGNASDESDPAQRVLAYRSPPTVVKPPPDNLRAMGLFLVGIVAGPIATVMLATGAGPSAVIVPIAGIILACIPGYRGLGAGILVGIGLAILIVLSICGGWFR
jgi:hypothetical protein